MNPRSRWLAILALVAIFLAGGVTGWLLRPAGRPHGPPRGEDLATHLRTRLTRELALTPEQVTKITPIVAETANQIETSRRNVEEQVGREFDEMHAKLGAVLTPDQMQKLAALRDKRRAMRDARPPR
jgi:hypothetical protein